MLDRKTIRRIKRRLETESPTIWIGKNGITGEIVSEVDRQLKERAVLKLKIQKTALKDNDTRTIAEEIASRTQSSLVEARGHTFILYRAKDKPVVANP